MRTAIIGGGIAGLSAAYELSLHGAEFELFEASTRLGGVLSSQIVDQTVIEHGPDSFLTEKPAALALCRELGLGDDLIPSNDAERKTFILVKNRLVPLPDGLMFLIPTKLLPTALTQLFSWPTKLRMALELLHPPRPSSGDESVASLVRRHYGQQAVDRLASPLLSGIYGGDAEQLSAPSVLARLVEMEAKYGSLTRGMLAGMRNAAKAQPSSQGAPSAPRPIFTTLRGGVQQLVDALIARLDPARLHVSSPVARLERDAEGWHLTAPSSSRLFDAVILATPAWSAAQLLQSADPALAASLAEIPYSSSVTLNLVFEAEKLGPLPPGFGFLIPAAEGRSMLACTFLHRKFPGRTASGKAVLRAFLGGSRNPGILAEPDSVLTEIVRRELREILHISATPESVYVQRWPRAMAQYAVGHKARQQRIADLTANLPGLQLIGNAYDGIGISDCIRLGRNAARTVVCGAEGPVAASAVSVSV
jgi:oxygen-dependent protoporphyrinogen oxidase